MKAIITFHSVDSSGSVLSYAPHAFADLVRTLVDSSLPVCDLDMLLDPGTPRGIALTFDDGMASVFSRALPVLAECRVPAHLFLTTASVGGDNRWAGQHQYAPAFTMLDWNQVEACYAGGLYIEGHTATHSDLRRLTDAAIEADCADADELIERRLGRKPAYFAYPYGYSNARVRKLARARYRGCVTTKLRPLSTSEDLAALPRIDAYYLRSPRVYRRVCSVSITYDLAGRSLRRTMRGTP